VKDEQDEEFDRDGPDQDKSEKDKVISYSVVKKS